MLSRIVFVMAVSVWGWSSHHQHTEAAFLASAPKQEEVRRTDGGENRGTQTTSLGTEIGTPWKKSRVQEF